jgi:hypothetical protein
VNAEGEPKAEGGDDNGERSDAERDEKPATMKGDVHLAMRVQAGSGAFGSRVIGVAREPS